MPLSKNDKNDLVAMAHQAEAVSKLMLNPKLQDAYRQLHESDEARKEATTDFNAYLTKRGVTVPEGLKSKFIANNWRTTHCFSWKGGGFCFHYDSAERGGFGWGP